jgi:hypothetical protein
MVCRTPNPPRNISLTEPIFERSRLSEEFLAVAHEQVFPTVQQAVASRPETPHAKAEQPQEARRA